MTVNELVKSLNLECLTGENELDKEVTGGYCGDLLSWVMSKAQSGDAWVTIMSNINIVAVAVLTDVSCIILCEGVNPEQDCLEKAKEQGVVILKSSMSAFELSNKIGNLI